MAAYQFFLDVVPKSALLENYDRVPDKISFSKKTDVFDSYIRKLGKIAEIDPTQTIREIDDLLPRADWGNDKRMHNWKTKTEKVDNDAVLIVNEQTEYIEHLSFRADLREERLQFLMNMIELGKKFDWTFMDSKDNLANPDGLEIKKIVANSNAYRFISNPRQFLDDLQSGKLKIE